MKTSKNLISRIICASAACLAATFAHAQISPTALTYNGKLTDGTNGVNGWYDFQMAVFTNATGGSSLGNGTQTVAHIAVISGSFTVTADFGTNLFDGSARWLELAVHTNGGGAFVAMTPRYTVGSVPVAQYALTPASYIGPKGIAVFNNSGTWTKPAGVTSVLVKLWGAGGGGQVGGSGSADGGGGAYCEGVVAVSNNVLVTVGSAGTNGSDFVGTSATAGGTSSFLSLVANGGGGATATSISGGGGSASGGAINSSGQSGHWSQSNGAQGGSNGYPGAAPGTGVGGFPGGAGTGGMVIIYY